MNSELDLTQQRLYFIQDFIITKIKSGSTATGLELAEEAIQAWDAMTK